MMGAGTRIATASIVLAAATALVSLWYRGATDFNFLLRHYSLRTPGVVDAKGRAHTLAVIPLELSGSQTFWTLVSRYREGRDALAMAPQPPAPLVLNMGGSGTSPGYGSNPALEFAARGDDVLVYSGGANDMTANLIEAMLIPDEVLANSQILFNFYLGWAREADSGSWKRFQDAGRPEGVLHALSNAQFDPEARQELIQQCLGSAKTSLRFICRLASQPIALRMTDWVASLFVKLDSTLIETYDAILPPYLLFPDLHGWKSWNGLLRVDHSGQPCGRLLQDDMRAFLRISQGQRIWRNKGGSISNAHQRK